MMSLRIFSRKESRYLGRLKDIGGDMGDNIKMDLKK
jgi:hypothetical protein